MSEHTYQQEKTVHTKQAWIVVITASLFFFYEFIQMNIFNSINTPLRETFHLDAVQLGQLFSMYFYANFLCLLPVGNLLDRASTKKCLLFALSLCTIGTFMFGLAEQYWVAAVGRFLVGIGASFCFLSCIRIASRWFPPRKMAFVTGVIVTMAMIGGLVAQTPFSLLAEYLGNWRHAFLVNAFLGIAIIIVTMLVVQDYPSDMKENKEEGKKQLQTLGLLGCLKLAALNPQNWLGGLYTSFMNLPVFIVGGLWGILYLKDVRHLDVAQASYVTTLFFMGVIVGSLVFGWVSDYIERRVLPMIVGAVFSLFAMLALIYLPELSFTALLVLFFFIGFITSSQVLSYPTIAELNPAYLTSTAVSIDSLCIMASGFIIPPLFGALMERGQHEMVNGVAVYTAANFNSAMIIMPISIVIALVISFFIRETYCRMQV